MKASLLSLQIIMLLYYSHLNSVLSSSFILTQLSVMDLPGYSIINKLQLLILKWQFKATGMNIDCCCSNITIIILILLTGLSVCD